MLISLLRFEWRYHTRSAAFYAACALFFLFGIVLTANFGPDSVAATSPYLVTQSTALSSLFTLFAIAIFVATAILRDDEHRMIEIVHSTPLPRLAYVLTRFGGAMLAALTASALTIAGMVLATQLPWIDPERIGRLDPAAYAFAFATVLVPNVLFATAVLFAVATWTRSTIGTTVASVALYALYFVAAALGDSPIMAQSKPGAGSGLTAAVLDPFGLTAFFFDTRYWTLLEKNSRAVEFAGTFLVNRLGVVAVSALIWLLTYRTFTFRVSRSRGGKRQDDTPATSPVASTYAAVTPEPSWKRVQVRAFLSAAALETRLVLRSIPFLLVQLAWFVVAITELRADLFDLEYGSAAIPTTALVVAALRNPTFLISTILLVYYSAEIFWRESRTRIAPLIHTTRISASTLLAAKLAAAVALILATNLVGVLAGVLLQLTRGFTELEPQLYLAHLWFTAWPVILLAVGAALVHAFSPGKYVGMVGTLLFVALSRRASSLGLEHPLWSFAGGPPVTYSAMNGYGSDAAPFLWFMLHWTLVAALMAVVAAAMWRRLDLPVRERVRALAADRSMHRQAIVLSLLAIATGSWIYYNTSILTRQRGAEEVLAWKAAYEKRYGADATAARPRVTGLDAAFDLHPESRSYRVRGTYTVVNDDAAPLTELLVAMRRNAENVKLSMRGASADPRDEAFGMQRFIFDPPLAPGASTTLAFEADFSYRGFSRTDPNDAIVDNGSLLFSYFSLPSFGYRASYQIRDPRERKKRGLPPGIATEESELGTDEVSSDNDRIHVDLAVTVPADQQVVAPGNLTGVTRDRGRATFRFRTATPIVNRFAITAGRYEVARRRHGNTLVELYHHPEHGANTTRILDAATAMLAELEPRIGAYPHRHLRLAEVPAFASFGAFAPPEAALLSETRVMLVDGSDPARLDLVSRRVAHEVAHQYWGYRVIPANAAGAATLVESLTKYSELMALRRLHGEGQVRRQLEVEHDRYLSGRANSAREETLFDTREQSHVHYAKGSLVMNAIQHLIGRDAMDAALAGLTREFEGQPARATTADLLRHMKAHASPAHARLIDEWMKEVIFHDLRLRSASAARRPDGRFDVTLEITASRAAIDERGVERARPLDDRVGIALTTYGADGAERTLHESEARVVTGVNRIRLIVDAKPTFATIDPAVLRIERNRTDNTLRVE